jgi:nucleotidyltransferase/DNA polymerase involved in DNA repair
MKPKVIGHLDADCFYVSAERVRFPFLAGQPVGVLGNQGACVIAKSYELKAHGVQTGMPIWDALPLCPDAIFIKRDFRWYEVLSRRIVDAVKQVSPHVEYYSIDEAFFDAGELARTPSLFGQAAEELQNHILHHIGVPTSVGVSLSRTLAKLLSDSAKPFGCTVMLEKDEIEEFIKTQPVEEMSGIGERSRAKLASHKIFTCWDYAQADRHFIRRLLTIKGESLWWELHGEAVNPIVTKRPPNKCIGRGGSIGAGTTDIDIIRAWAVRNTERLIEELDFHQVFTGRLSLALQFKEGGWCGRATLPTATANFNVIVRAAKQLLDVACQAKPFVSGMHILAEKLTKRQDVQLDLFVPNHRSVDALSNLKHAINEKLGRFAVRSADTLPLAEIYDDRANQYDICDVHGKTCF